jgi:hypothetical protein
LMHPATAAALNSARQLMYAVDELSEKIDRVRARRPSRTGRVIPEIDALGRLTDLYIAPGTVAAMADNHELIREIMGAIVESTRDAARQRCGIMAEATFPDGAAPPVTDEQRRTAAIAFAALRDGNGPRLPVGRAT